MVQTTSELFFIFYFFFPTVFECFLYSWKVIKVVILGELSRPINGFYGGEIFHFCQKRRSL